MSIGVTSGIRIKRLIGPDRAVQLTPREQDLAVHPHFDVNATVLALKCVDREAWTCKREPEREKLTHTTIVPRVGT